MGGRAPKKKGVSAGQLLCLRVKMCLDIGERRSLGARQSPGRLLRHSRGLGRRAGRHASVVGVGKGQVGVGVAVAENTLAK